jgi:hypothetical protein
MGLVGSDHHFLRAGCADDRFFGWMRDRGFGFLLVGDRAYEVWFGRFVQICAIGIGIVGLVQFLSD